MKSMISKVRSQLNRTESVLLSLIFLIGFILMVLMLTHSHFNQSDWLVNLYQEGNAPIIRQDLNRSDVEEAKVALSPLTSWQQGKYRSMFNRAEARLDAQDAIQAFFVTGEMDDSYIQSYQSEKTKVPVIHPETTIEDFEQFELQLKQLVPSDPMVQSMQQIVTDAKKMMEVRDQAHAEVTQLPADLLNEPQVTQALQQLLDIESTYQSLWGHGAFAPVKDEIQLYVLGLHDAVSTMDIAESDLLASVAESELLSDAVKYTSLDSRKYASLTYDDGPNVDYTQAVLNVLDKHGVEGTFFVMGAYVDAYPEIALEIHERGHHLGNHSYNHFDYLTLSDEEIMQQIEWTEMSIEEATGSKPHMYRFPFGSGDDHTVDLLSDYVSILWNVDTLDWMSHDVASILEVVEAHAQSGEDLLILMHDTHEATAPATDQIIQLLKELGYEFTTPDQVRFKQRYF